MSWKGGIWEVERGRCRSWSTKRGRETDAGRRLLPGLHVPGRKTTGESRVNRPGGIARGHRRGSARSAGVEPWRLLEGRSEG